jgi:hypothetical protein
MSATDTERIAALEHRVDELEHAFDATIRARTPERPNAWLAETELEPLFGYDVVDVDEGASIRRRGDGERGPRLHELIAGERVEGSVRRLPEPGAQLGNYLLLETADGVLALGATARKGHTVLERLLVDEGIAVGDDVAITFRGKRRTVDGEHEYRHYELERL